jgi:5'-deoxynucleotidase YfbR-like HD superfamily hydrolase
MALMLCYFQNKIKLEFNFEKAMKMILIHDIPEIIA